MQAAAECANILRQPFFMKMTETEEFTVKKGNQYEGVVAYVDFPDKGYVTVRVETESGAEQEILVLGKLLMRLCLLIIYIKIKRLKNFIKLIVVKIL